MVDLADFEGLIYVVAGRYEDGGCEDEAEDGEGCGVEDVEEGDAAEYGDVGTSGTHGWGSERIAPVTMLVGIYVVAGGLPNLELLITPRRRDRLNATTVTGRTNLNDFIQLHFCKWSRLIVVSTIL